jgi:hypothetical protein
MSANFASVMTQMRDHYKSGATQPFVIQHHVAPMAALGITPQMAVTPAGFAKLRASSQAELPAGFDDLQSTAKSAETATVETCKTDVSSTVDKLKDDKDQNSFASRMNAQRAKAKADSDKTIDDAFDKATAMGQDQPAAVQDLMLQGMNVITNTIQSVVNVVANFIEGLAQKVLDILKGILDAGMKFIESGFKPALELLSFL